MDLSAAITETMNKTLLSAPSEGSRSHWKDKKADKVLDKELTELRQNMDSKMMDLEDLERLTEKNKPAAHILENVMADMEQRNSELTSLYRSSEKNRSDMEDMLKEQTNELKTLRANTVVMQTLETEVNELTEKNDELGNKIKSNEQELVQSKKMEQMLMQKIRDMERQAEHSSHEQNVKINELVNKISYCNDQLAEKDNIIVKTEQTVKELFEKCQQLGTNALEVKKELSICIESGNRLKDLNTKLQYCKEYLEEQLDNLINEMKAAKVENEQLKLEYAGINGDKQTCAKHIVLLNEELTNSGNEITHLKGTLKNVQTHLKEFETGEMRSAVVVNEIKKDRRTFQSIKESLEKKVLELEAKRESVEEDLRQASLNEKKQNTRLMEMESKIIYFQDNFIEKQELLKTKKELEVKYKLDMGSHMKRISALFDKEQEEVGKAMQLSLALREEVNSILPSENRDREGGSSSEYLY